MSVASPIRALSEALGVWCGPGSSGPHHDPGARVYHRVAAVRDGQRYRWEVRPTGAGGIHVMRWEPDEATGVRMVGEWTLTEAEALLWLLLYAIPPDRETCPDCEGLGLQRGRATCEAQRRDYIDQGWNIGEPIWSPDYAGPGSGKVYPTSRPCPTCTGPVTTCETCDGCGHDPPQYWNGLGHHPCTDCDESGSCSGESTGYVDVHTWARRFLGATTRVIGPAEFETAPWPEWSILSAHGEGDDRRWTVTRYPDDRDELSVLADRLQAGDGPELFADDDARLLGEALALWLTQAPCEDISCVLDFPDQCASCGGSGLALGALIPALTDLAQWMADTVGGQP